MNDLLPWMAPYSAWTLYVLGLLVGARLVVRGLRRRPVRGRDGCCAQCGYDLTGAPTLTCSECGHRRDSASASTRFRRRPMLVVLGLVVACALPAFAAQRRVRAYGWAYYLRVGPGYWVAPDLVKKELRHGDYLVRITEDRRNDWDDARYRGDRCTVYRRGRRAWSADAWYLSFGMANEASSHRLGFSPLGPLADIDGDGAPELLITGNPGGNSGSTTLYILNLGPDGVSKMLDHPKDADYDNLHGAADLDGDGAMEFVALDHSFVFLGTCHAGSIYPRVGYAIRDGKVVPDAAVTRRLNPIDDVELAALRKDCIDAGWHPQIEDRLFGPLVRAMTMLICAGRSREAYAFVDDVWRGPDDAKQKFLAEFNGRLQQSPIRVAIER